MRPLPPIAPGTQLAHLTVVALAPERSIRGERTYLCRCRCGAETYQTASALKHGNAKSCGCIARDRQRESQLAHGESRQRGVHNGTAEYRTWRNIIIRCYNTKARFFYNYGGRGITVCDRWRHSYEAFLADMGRRPSPRHSIERIENDGPYAPDNCKWATRAEQMTNRRVTLWIIEDGERIQAKAWAERERVRYGTVRSIFRRLHVRTLAIHEAPSS